MQSRDPLYPLQDGQLRPQLRPEMRGSEHEVDATTCQ